jgi:hypothetical protein
LARAHEKFIDRQTLKLESAGKRCRPVIGFVYHRKKISARVGIEGSAAVKDITDKRGRRVLSKSKEVLAAVQKLKSVIT